MKKLTMLMAFLVSSSAFALGAGQKWDFRQGIKPAGFTLGEVCYDQGSYISTVSKSSCAKYERVLADDDQKYELNPRMRNTCVAWDSVKAGQVIPGTIIDCVEWERIPDFNNDGNSDYKTVCVATGPVEVKRTQRLDVYQNFSGSKYISSEDQLMGSEMFTVPACESDKSGDLPDEDVPDTKK